MVEEKSGSGSTDRPLPALKAGIEAVQIEHEGKPMILLRDQEGITEHAIAVTLPGFLIAMMLDGRHTVADVQSLFAKNTGALLSPDEVTNMVKQLEKSDLLETEGLAQKRRKIMDDFLSNPIRGSGPGCGPSFCTRPICRASPPKTKRSISGRFGRSTTMLRALGNWKLSFSSYTQGPFLPTPLLSGASSAWPRRSPSRSRKTPEAASC